MEYNYKVYAYYTEYDRDGEKYIDYDWWPAGTQEEAQKIVDNLQSGWYNQVEIREV
jgi:hypothetical protein